MKKFSLFLMASLFTTSLFAGTCSKVVEKIFKDEGMQTQRPVLVFQDGDVQQYTIRTNLHGGDAEHLVTTTSDCKIVEVKTLWAE